MPNTPSLIGEGFSGMFTFFKLKSNDLLTGYLYN